METPILPNDMNSASLVCAGSLLHNHLGGAPQSNLDLVRQIASQATVSQTLSVIAQIKGLSDRVHQLFPYHMSVSDVMQTVCAQMLATRLGDPAIPALWASAVVELKETSNINRVFAHLSNSAQSTKYFPQLIALLNEANLGPTTWQHNTALCEMIGIGALRDGSGRNLKMLLDDINTNAPVVYHARWVALGNAILNTSIRPRISRKAFNAWWNAAPLEGLKSAWIERLLPQLIHHGAPNSSEEHNDRWINLMIDHLNDAPSHQKLADLLGSFVRFSSSPRPVDGVNNILIHCSRRLPVLQEQFSVWEEFNTKINEEELFNSPQSKHVSHTWKEIWSQLERHFIQSQIVGHVMGKVGTNRKM